MADVPELAEPFETSDPLPGLEIPAYLDVDGDRPAELNEVPTRLQPFLGFDAVPETTDPTAADAAGAADSGTAAGVSAAPSVPGVARTTPAPSPGSVSVGEPRAPLAEVSLPQVGPEDQLTDSPGPGTLETVTGWFAEILAPEGTGRGQISRDAELAGVPLTGSESAPVRQVGSVASDETGGAPEPQSEVADWLSRFPAPDGADRGETPRGAELAGGSIAQSPSAPAGQPGRIAPDGASVSQSTVAGPRTEVLAPDGVDRSEVPRAVGLAGGSLVASPSVPVVQPGRVASEATSGALVSQSAVADLLAEVLAPDSVDRGGDPREAELADVLLSERPSVPVVQPGRVASEATGGAIESQSAVADLLAEVLAPDSVDRSGDPREAQLADGLPSERPSVPVVKPGLVASDESGEVLGSRAVVEAGNSLLPWRKTIPDNALCCRVRWNRAVRRRPP